MDPVISSVENVGISETASEVQKETAKNIALDATAAGVAQPVEGGDGWKREPVDNFKQDASGNVVMRDGKPVRRFPGKPRKAKPGDRLAGGGVMDGEAQNDISFVSVPEAVSGPGGDEGPLPPGQDESMGTEAGEVVSDLILNTADAVGGEKVKPTTAEREAIRKHAGRALGGAVLSPWTALAVIVAGWAVRVVVQKRSERAKADGVAHIDNRADGHGKNASSKTARYVYNLG